MAYYPQLDRFNEVLDGLAGIDPTLLQTELVRYMAENNSDVVSRPIHLQNTTIVLERLYRQAISSLVLVQNFLAGNLALLGFIQPGYPVFCLAGHAQELMTRFDNNLLKLVAAGLPEVHVAWTLIGQEGFQTLPDPQQN